MADRFGPRTIEEAPAREAVVDRPPIRRVFDMVALVGFFYFVQQFFWPSPIGVIVQGCIIGGLTALISFGIALIYRANRVINFAQGDLGASPAALTVLLIVGGPTLPYFVALPVLIISAIALGALVEFLIIRRFFNSPRLILTVVTLALTQLLTGLGLVLPRLFNLSTPPQSFPSPFDFSFKIHPIIFRGNDIIAMLAVPLVIVALGAFFRYTHVGIAVRASAESAERAALLGVPVKRVQTIVWVIATVLAALAIFMRAGIVGLPIGRVLGPAILIRALTACVIGRMENLPRIFVGAIGLGIIEQSIVWHTGRGIIVAPIMFVIVLGALLVQRRGIVARADIMSTWQAAKAVRPMPRELAGLGEVRYTTLALKVVGVIAVLVAPRFLPESRVNLVAVIMIVSIIGLSLVVLTGWAGQVSLGQMAFVGLGGAVAASVTTRLHWDLSIGLVLGGLAGALIAVIIGLPALRIRGLFLAVTTLAFGLATEQYLLNEEFFGWWLPRSDDRILRTPLLGVISIDSEIRFYYFAFAVLLGALGVVRGVRNSRTGRALIGVRENERAAESFGVNAVGAKLTAFAISGFLAAFAGGMFVHHQQALDVRSFSPIGSLDVFVMVVIGGLGSPAGAILGASFQRGVSYFVPQLRFFTSGLGLIVILMLVPGGLGSLLYQIRDGALRLLARRKGILVPSLLADSRDSTVQLATERTFDFADLSVGATGAVPWVGDLESSPTELVAEVELAEEAFAPVKNRVKKVQAEKVPARKKAAAKKAAATKTAKRTTGARR